MAVTLYYEDSREEFEVDAVPGSDAMWMALPDWNTLRRLQG